MMATSQAGRRALDELTVSRGEYEATLALGVPKWAAALFAALTPPLDQTRTVGLVTLPRSFVGVLIGSDDSVQAGAARLWMLGGLPGPGR
jgi:putative ABC transport system permease protein